MTYVVFARHHRWAGCRLAPRGNRVVVARGNVIVPPEQKRPPFWRLNRRHNQLLLLLFHLSKANLPTNFEAPKRFRPDVAEGYSSTLYLLAKFLQNGRERFPLKAEITSSETLFDFRRELIEEPFARRVFDDYALAERVAFSGGCERVEGHYIAMEYVVADVVDDHGAPATPGSAGRLVGTSPHNMAMPLRRYATTDMTALRETERGCGRGLPLMDDDSTKTEDAITLKDGRLISPSVLTHPFKPLDCIEGSQIVQLAPDAVTVRIVPKPEYTPAHTQHLVTGLQARLGEGIRIDVQMVDRLETSANGRFNWGISHVPLGI